MRFVTIREFREKTAAVRRAMDREGEIVLTLNGRPIALLTPATGEDLEEQLQAVRRARAGIALRRVRKAARKGGKDRMSAEAIDGVIREARRSRRSVSGGGR